MIEHAFEVFAAGAVLDDPLPNKLHEAGCDDASIADAEAGLIVLMFDREAPTLGEAVVSAIRDIQRANVGLRIVRVEPAEAAAAALEYAGQQALAAS